jgi:hypothetical protein
VLLRPVFSAVKSLQTTFDNIFGKMKKGGLSVLRYRTSVVLFLLLSVSLLVGFAVFPFRAVQASNQNGPDIQSPQTAADYVKTGRDLNIKGQNEQAIQAYRRAIELSLLHHLVE